jgi:hypothetical protein
MNTSSKYFFTRLSTLREDSQENSNEYEQQSDTSDFDIIDLHEGI